MRGFLDIDGRLWRAVIKATRDGSKTFPQTLHKVKRRDFAAARRRLTRGGT